MGSAGLLNKMVVKAEDAVCERKEREKQGIMRFSFQYLA